MAPEHDMRDKAAVWSLQKRLGFLILALFLVQNAAPLVAWVVPVLGRAVLLPAWQAAWNAVVPWVGEHVLRLAEPITILPNGSGDTTWNYVQMFTMAAISVIVATPTATRSSPAAPRSSPAPCCSRAGPRRSAPSCRSACSPTSPR